MENPDDTPSSNASAQLSSTKPSSAAGAPSAPDVQAVAQALSDCVRETLERGEPAEVPGMGTFRVEHQPSRMNEQTEGRYSVTPPRDAVVFEPVSS